MRRDPKRCPTHPGEVLREDVFPATGISKVEISRRLGISRQHLYDILGEKKPVSAEIAVRIGKFLGNDPILWVRMQGAFDTWMAAENVDVSNIQTVHAAE